MNVRVVLAGFFTGMALVALGFVIGSVRLPRPLPEPCKLEEPAPVDAQMWLYRGLDLCEKKCGPVPFDVEVEPLRVRCNCGRPARLAR